MGILGILLVSIMVAGCTNAFTGNTGELETKEPDTAESADTLTQPDYLAISRLVESKTIDVETLEKYER
jgi:hypothetical protein